MKKYLELKLKIILYICKVFESAVNKLDNTANKIETKLDKIENERTT